MQRILNNPDDMVDEMVEGFCKAHKEIVKHVVTGEDNPRGVVAAINAPVQGKVGVVTGGIIRSSHPPVLEEAYQNLKSAQLEKCHQLRRFLLYCTKLACSIRIFYTNLWANRRLKTEMKTTIIHGERKERRQQKT